MINVVLQLYRKISNNNIFFRRSLSKQPVHVLNLQDKIELKTYAYLFEIQQSLILTPLRFGSLAQANQVGKQFACRLDWSLLDECCGK